MGILPLRPRRSRLNWRVLEKHPRSKAEEKGGQTVHFLTHPLQRNLRNLSGREREIGQEGRKRELLVLNYYDWSNTASSLQSKGGEARMRSLRRDVIYTWHLGAGSQGEGGVRGVRKWDFQGGELGRR